MTEHPVTRNDIIAAFMTELKPLDYIHALWEAGAAAFGRVDQWSDADLYLVVDDDRVEETFQVIEGIVHTLAGPSPHGMVTLKFSIVSNKQALFCFLTSP
jgi:hypothetical protein